MRPSWNILHAMLHCHYKAWQIARSEDEQINIHRNLYVTTETPLEIPINSFTPVDKFILTAFCQTESQADKGLQPDIPIRFRNLQTSTIRIKLNSKKAQKLFADAQRIITEDAQPAFYKNA